LPRSIRLSQLLSYCGGSLHVLCTVGSWPHVGLRAQVNIPGYSFIEPEPLGVALVIGAWNYPVQLTLMPIVGAIAAGNAVCVKVPSDKYSGECSRVLAECVHKYLDQEAVCVIQGDRKETQAVLEEKWE